MTDSIAKYFFLLCLPMIVSAQEATFTAELESPSVPAGQQFRLSYVFSGSGSGSPSNLKPSDFGQFVVIAGPNTSQSFQFINGAASVSITYSYTLYARQEGTYTLGPASVTYKGKTISTQPLTVTVTKAGAAPQQQNQEQDPAVQIGDNILLRAEADRDHVRQGEQVTVTWKIYTRVGMSISRIAKIPTFEGFWGEDFEIPQQPALVNEVFNGKQYRMATLKKTALFPSQTGRLTVGPMEIVCAVQVQSQRRNRDPFDQFFNDPFFQRFKSVEVEFSSNPVTIRVDPLPSGAPEGFSNAVGTFTFDATIDKREVPAGDAITLRLKIEGTGNIKLVSLPTPDVPADIEVFDPTLSEDIRREGNSVRGSKSAEYVLVPRNAGRRTIDPIAFSYYDPGRRAFRTLRSDAFPLTILPGKELAMGAAGIGREDVLLLGEDIRFIKLEPGDLRTTGEQERFGNIFFFFLLFPPVLFVGAFIYRKRMEKVYGDLPSLRFERAGKEATKRLKKARALLSQGNAEEYNAEILRALSGYLEHKLRISKSSLGMDEVITTLAGHSVKTETLDQLRASVERAEFSRYAPGGDTTEARQDLFERADQIIRSIDREYKA